MAKVGGGVVPNDDPMMIEVNRVWDNETTFAQRRAFIEVTLKNSKKPQDIKMFQEVAAIIQEALKDLDK